MRRLPLCSLFAASATIACGAFVIRPCPLRGKGGEVKTLSLRVLGTQPKSQLQPSDGLDDAATTTGEDRRDRIRHAYMEWCKSYNVKYDPARLEIFAFHYLLADEHSKATGQPLHLNEFATFTEAEYEEYIQSQQEASSLEKSVPENTYGDTSQPSVPRIASRGNLLDNDSPSGKEIRFPNAAGKWNVQKPKPLRPLRDVLHGAKPKPSTIQLDRTHKWNSVPRIASRGNAVTSNRPQHPLPPQTSSGFQKTDIKLENNHTWNTVPRMASRGNFANVNRPTSGKPAGRKKFTKTSKWNVSLPKYYMRDKLVITETNIPHDDFDPFGSAYYGSTRNLEAAASRPQDPWLNGVDTAKESRTDHLIRVGPLHIEEATHFWMGHR